MRNAGHKTLKIKSANKKAFKKEVMDLLENSGSFLYKVPTQLIKTWTTHKGRYQTSDAESNQGRRVYKYLPTTARGQNVRLEGTG